MRSNRLSVIGLFAVASAIIAIASGVGSIAHAGSAQTLSGDTLRRNIPGAKINLDTPLGTVVPVSYGESGERNGRAGAVAFYLGADRDKGRWWIDGSRLCHQWTVWFDGKKKCFTIQLTSDNRIYWRDQSGDTGTGTIVALAPRREPAPVRSEVASATQPTPVASRQKPVSPPQRKAQVARSPQAKHQGAVGARVASVTPSHVSRATRGLVANDANTSRQPQPPQVKQSAASTRVETGVLYQVTNVQSDDVLNVRSGPSATTSIVGALRPNTTGIRFAGKCYDDWCPIEHGRVIGWANRFFLVAAGGQRQVASSGDDRRAVSYRVIHVADYDVLNIRSRPNMESAVRGTIPPNGRRVKMTGYCVGEWCPISYGRTSGWVNRYYLTLDY